MLDSMMERLKAEESVNINEFLKEMRSKRMYLVQTLVSIVLLHLYVCVCIVYHAHVHWSLTCFSIIMMLIPDSLIFSLSTYSYMMHWMS